MITILIITNRTTSFKDFSRYKDYLCLTTNNIDELWINDIYLSIYMA